MKSNFIFKTEDDAAGASGDTPRKCTVCENEAENIVKCFHCDRMVCQSCKQSHTGEYTNQNEIGCICLKYGFRSPGRPWNLSWSLNIFENRFEKSSVNFAVENNVRTLNVKPRKFVFYSHKIKSTSVYLHFVNILQAIKPLSSTLCLMNKTVLKGFLLDRVDMDSDYFENWL